MTDFDDPSGTSGAKLPLTPDGTNAIQRLGRWMRIVGTIQMAIAGMFLLFMLTMLGGAMSAGTTAMIVVLVFVVGAAVWLMQGLRSQTAGEQLKNLAEGHDIDYLELAFVRLRTVFVLDLVMALVIGVDWIIP